MSLSPRTSRVARVAALFVQKNGCYYGLSGVDPWPMDRDARRYLGPYKVVAHPPCARWGHYATGSPSTAGRYTLGDDGGCFSAALRAVRQWGGVLEHPRRSKAWKWFGLAAPPDEGGWVKADEGAGWTCCVYQGHYGHRAMKPTWLYAAHVPLPSLVWGEPPRAVHPTSPRRGTIETMSRRQRAATPVAFRDVLLALARGADHGW